MPNHWESSTRPIFVKTVFVNGNRHAILSEEDPLLHLGVPFSKKQSRPSSPLSIFSISSTQSQESVSKRTKSSKYQRNGKDVSSELQDCLIKLRLASGTHEKREKAKRTESFGEDQEEKWEKKSEKENSRQKKRNRLETKSNKKSSGYEKNLKQNSDIKKESNNCCYIYNFEKGEKNKYCFVKITSKPSHLILNCSCDQNGGTSYEFCGSKDSLPSNKNNFVISATFHNLIMTTDAKEKISQSSSSDYWFSIAEADSCEVYWNNYLTKSYYNSLSERVIQWLDMASKRKKQDDVIEISPNEVLINDIERIFAGKTFLDENDMSKPELKKNRKVAVRKEKDKYKEIEAQEADIETGKTVDENIETALSVQKLRNDYHESSDEANSCRSFKSEDRDVHRLPLKKNYEDEYNSAMISIPTNFNSTSDSLKNSVENSFVSTILSTSKFPVNTQELSLNEDVFHLSTSDRFRKKNSKEKRSSLVRQSKCKEFEETSTANKGFRISAKKQGDKNLNEQNSLYRCNAFDESIICSCEMNLNGYGKRIKSQNLTQEFEKNYKSINNSNITRTKTISHNLLSPQQHNKAHWLKEGKSVWPSEKEMGRPQLHIFIPSLPSKEINEECVTECDSCLGEIH